MKVRIVPLNNVSHLRKIHITNHDNVHSVYSMLPPNSNDYKPNKAVIISELTRCGENCLVFTDEKLCGPH